MVLLFLLWSFVLFSFSQIEASPYFVNRFKLSSLSKSSLEFLQKEVDGLAQAQQRYREYLVERKIPVGSDKSRALKDGSELNRKPEIAVSTEEAPLDCRLSLSTVPPGTKCIAPCSCTGSQKWVQVSVLNRFRRKDPKQWITCQTCQQKFDYSPFVQQGGVMGNLLSAFLDRRWLFRSLVAMGVSVGFYIVDGAGWLQRLAVSELVWQNYITWSRVFGLPTILLLWGVKLGVQMAGQWYLAAEQNVISRLADVESEILEDRLQPSVSDTGISTGSDENMEGMNDSS